MYIHGLWRKYDYLYGQLFVLIILNLFAGFLFTWHFFSTKSLYWDNLKLFAVFRDNLHSLNYFGQTAWWNPNAQEYGFPEYYFSILGTNTTTPLFILTAFVAWMLGVIGVHIESYVSLYIVYFGFLVPLLLSLSSLLVARRIFKSQKVLLFVILASAFSPGIIFNLSDNGVEQTAYGLFFAASFLGFLENPGKKAFLPLALSLFVLAVSFNHLSLYWNAVFVPLFVIASVAFRQESLSETLKKLKGGIPSGYMVVALLLAAICILPTVITYSQGEDIVRSTINERTYKYGDLRPGNPMEVLSVSTPGIGFKWNPESSLYGADLVSTSDDVEGLHLGYSYMGLLMLPLALVGLMGGRKPWRTRLLFLLIIMSTVVILSGFSPIFSVLLFLPTPLQAVNHYSDTIFRNGTFYIMLLSAGLGMELILMNRGPWRKVFVKIFAATSAFSILFMLALGKASTANAPVFGFALLMTLLYLIVLFRLSRFKSPVLSNKLTLFLFLLFLIDVSSVSYRHVRTIVHANSSSYEEPRLTEIGTKSYPSHLETVLRFRDSREIDKIARAYSLPEAGLYDNAYSLQSEGVNLIKNAGFEDCDFSGWTQNSSVIDKNVKHSGNCSSKLTATGGNISGAVSDFVKVNPQNTYILTARHKVSEKAGGGYFFLILFYDSSKEGISQDILYQDGGNTKDWIKSAKTIGPRDPWSDITFPEGTAFVRVAQTWWGENPTGTGYIDDVGLSEAFPYGSALMLPEKYRESPDFRPFFDRPLDKNLPGDFKLTEKTYDGYVFEASLSRDSLFFIRDAYSPYWSATVNGKEKEIAKGYGKFKAVALPAGKSIITFRFSPGFLPYALLISYGIIFSAAALCVFYFIALRKS